MGIRGNIEKQSRTVRELIDKAIEREGFGNFVKLAEEFKRIGPGFSKSSIHRYAKKLWRFQQAAKYEAEMMKSFGPNIQWLITWARSYPRDADRLVARLQRRQAEFKEGRR
jgi:hypothetical protein